jgi:predicted PurR-regulated permease PerM
VSGLNKVLLSAAGFVVVVAGMRVASPILVPFLLAFFIAILCAPPLFWLQQKRIPQPVAIFILVLAIAVIGGLMATLLGSSLNSFISSLPSYQLQLQERTASLLSWLDRLGVDVSVRTLEEVFNPGTAVQMAANLFTTLSNMLTDTVLILLTVVFLLLEMSSIPQKIDAAFRRPVESGEHINSFISSVNRYLSIKTLISLCTGVVVFIFLKVLGLNHALLWGVLAFLLNFVPNIGSLIAAVPPVLLGLVQLGHWQALIIACGFVAINVTIGNFIEPRFMGKRLGLSTLVVFLSLVFWGWVLGPVGMLLSVPLTMIVKIALASSEETRWISIMLGSQ